MNTLDLRSSIPNRISRIGLYLFAFSIPISFIPAEFAVAITFLGWILEGIVNRQWKYYSTKLYYLLLFYLAWNIVSSVLSPRPAHSLWALMDNEWPMFIMLLMVSIIDDVEVIRRMVHLWMSTASLAAIYGIWQTFSGVQLHRPETLSPMGSYFRAVGFNGFYLTFAGFMMSVFLLSLCLGFQSNIKSRWKYVFVAAVSFLAVIATFARSIWLSFIVAVPIFGFFNGKRSGSIVTAVFLIIIILSIIFVPAIRERAYSIVLPSENQTRLNLWKTSINISKDFPVSGIGQDNFDYFFNQYKIEGYYDVTGHPHNDYLNVLVNSGVPGLLAFLSIWIIIIRKGFIIHKNSSNPFLKAVAFGSTLAILGFMVGGFFQNYYGTFANCWSWWFMAGLTMTSYKIHQKQKMVRS